MGFLILEGDTKYKLHLAKHNSCSTQIGHNTNVFPITCLCNMLTVTMLASPVTRKEYPGWNELKHIVFFGISASCLGFILFKLSWTLYSLSHAGLANSGRHLHHHLIHRTVLHPMVPFVELKWAFQAHHHCQSSPSQVLFSHVPPLGF